MSRIQFPDWYYRSIADIPIAELKKRGIRAILLDVDNTIAPQKGEHLTDEASAWIREAKNEGMVVILVSNTVTGGRRITRIARMAIEADVLFVCARFPRLKPHRHPYQQALRLAGVDKSQAVMIGDQLFTDVKGARRLGIFTILVKPLGGDHWATKPKRWLQNWVMRDYGYTN